MCYFFRLLLREEDLCSFNLQLFAYYRLFMIYRLNSMINVLSRFGMVKILLSNSSDIIVWIVFFFRLHRFILLFARTKKVAINFRFFTHVFFVWLMKKNNSELKKVAKSWETRFNLNDILAFCTSPVWNHFIH